MGTILRANLITVTTLDKWKTVFVGSFSVGAIYICTSLRSYLSLVNYNGLCDSLFSYLHRLVHMYAPAKKLLTNAAFHLSSVVTVISLAGKIVHISVET